MMLAVVLVILNWRYSGCDLQYSMTTTGRRVRWLIGPAFGPRSYCRLFTTPLPMRTRYSSARDFEIVVAMRERTRFPRSLLERLSKLQLLITTGMRNASIDVKAAIERGIVVSGTGMLPYPTMELCWGLILALTRNIVGEDAGMRKGEGQTTLGVGLSGKVLGVLGLGNLGSQVARIGKAFQMEVI